MQKSSAMHWKHCVMLCPMNHLKMVSDVLSHIIGVLNCNQSLYIFVSYDALFVNQILWWFSVQPLHIILATNNDIGERVKEIFSLCCSVVVHLTLLCLYNCIYTLFNLFKLEKRQFVSNSVMRFARFFEYVRGSFHK